MKKKIFKKTDTNVETLLRGEREDVTLPYLEKSGGGGGSLIQIFFFPPPPRERGEKKDI